MVLRIIEFLWKVLWFIKLYRWVYVQTCIDFPRNLQMVKDKNPEPLYPTITLLPKDTKIAP